VEALPFDSTLNMELPSAPEPVKQRNLTPLETLKQNPIILYGSAAGATLVIALVVFAVSRGKKREPARHMPEVLPPGSPIPSLTANPISQSGALAAAENPRLPALMPSRTEVLLTQLQESGRNNPEAWAGILRGWLSEEEAHS
jgi:flagellar biosynthesis/type III secretory pathway M-ring protein FliF/YscJ